jgi:hypothetical protein
MKMIFTVILDLPVTVVMSSRIFVSRGQSSQGLVPVGARKFDHEEVDINVDG